MTRLSRLLKDEPEKRHDQPALPGMEAALVPTITISPTQFLNTLLTEQERLQGRLGDPMRTGAVKLPDSAIKENVLALIVEATEILAEVNWKPWKMLPSQVKTIDRQKLLFEIVDAFQFLANILNEAGFSAQDLADAYAAKLQENYRRREVAERGSR